MTIILQPDQGCNRGMDDQPKGAGAEIRYCEVLQRNANVYIGIAKSAFSDFRNTNDFENSSSF